LYEVPAGVPFNLIIADDCTPEDKGRDELYAYLKPWKGKSKVKVCLSNQNRGFAGNNNWGVRQGYAPLILLLNSDTTIITPGWLKAMVDEFNDPSVGVVGAKLLFPEDSEDIKRPAGKIQHAGVVFNCLGQPYHVYLGWPPNDSRTCRQKEFQAVTGACLMTRRELWNRIGGLDPVYTVGNFEDVEYCLMAKELGYKVVYQPAASLVHYAGGSGNSETAKRNETIFRLRMQNFIRYDEYKHWEAAI